MGPSGRGRAAAGLWALIATASVILAPPGAAAAPVAGGAGSAIYFTSSKADIATFEWKNPSTDAITYELWYRVVDIHRLVVPLSYTVWDTSDPAAPYIHNEEFSVILNEPVFWRLFRGDKIITCNAQLGCPQYPHDRWVHLAVVYNGQEGKGYTKFFRDGVQVFDSSSLGPGGLTFVPLHKPGVFIFGQKPLDFFNGLDEKLSLDAFLDEVRLWNYERTESEIAASMHRKIDAATPGLAALFRFDEEPGSPMATDHTGSGNDAALGRLPDIRNEVFYVTARGAQPASSPRRVASRAPVYGGGVEAYVVEGGQVAIELTAWDDDVNATLACALESVPSLGTLHVVASGNDDDAAAQPTLSAGDSVADPDPARLQTKRVWYVPGPGFAAAGVDKFRYNVSDGLGGTDSAEVTVRLLELPPPDVPTLVTPEDVGVVVTLGAATVDGEQVWVDLLSLPENGTLYEIRFRPGPPKYPLTDFSNRDVLVTQDMLPYRVVDPSGALIYVPVPQASGYTVKFDYRWELKGALSGPGAPATTPPASMTIRVTPVNDGPVADPLLVTAMPEGGPVRIALNATDIDPTFAGMPQFRIVRAPRQGELWHLAAGPDPSEPYFLQAINHNDEVPTVIQWAKKLPPYNPEWGPSWTSQFDSGVCGSCCTIQATCDGDVSCGLSCAPNRFGWAEKALGPPDASLPGGARFDAWMPEDLMEDGIEFITVEFNFLVHISSVMIVEAAGPGAIVRVLVAREYRGNQTQWGVVWAGEPDPSIKASGVEMREFSPPVCVDSRAHGKFVRIESESGTITGFNSIDAIQIEGSQLIPQGLVMSEDGSVSYEVHPGVHGSRITCGSCGAGGIPFDHFVVLASDCVTEQEGEGTMYPIEAPAPGRAGVAPTVEELSSEIEYLVGAEEQDLTIPIKGAADLFLAAYGEEVAGNCSRSLHVALVGASPSLDDVSVHIHDGELAEDGSLVDIGGEDGEYFNGHIHVLASTRAFDELELEVWAGFCGATYRYRLHVKAACPAGSSPLDCATDTAACVAGGYSSYNQMEKWCNSGNDMSWEVAALACLAGILLGGILRSSAFRDNRDMIHMSTLRWTSPDVKEEYDKHARGLNSVTQLTPMLISGLIFCQIIFVAVVEHPFLIYSARWLSIISGLLLFCGLLVALGSSLVHVFREQVTRRFEYHPFCNSTVFLLVAGHHVGILVYMLHGADDEYPGENLGGDLENLVTVMAFSALVTPVMYSITNASWLALLPAQLASAAAFAASAYTSDYLSKWARVATLLGYLISIEVTYISLLYRLTSFVTAVLPGKISERLEMQQEVNRMRAAYVAATAHDLRTPIQAFRSVMDILHLDDGPPSGDLLEMGDAAVDMMTFTVENVLDFAKLDTGAEPAPMVGVLNVHTMVSNCANVTTSYVLGGGAEDVPLLIDLTQLPDVCKVETDAGWVQRMLMNLLSNARKFTEEGSVTIKVTVVPRTVVAGLVVLGEESLSGGGAKGTSTGSHTPVRSAVKQPKRSADEISTQGGGPSTTAANLKQVDIQLREGLADAGGKGKLPSRLLNASEDDLSRLAEGRKISSGGSTNNLPDLLRAAEEMDLLVERSGASFPNHGDRKSNVRFPPAALDSKYRKVVVAAPAAGSLVATSFVRPPPSRPPRSNDSDASSISRSNSVASYAQSLHSNAGQALGARATASTIRASHGLDRDVPQHVMMGRPSPSPGHSGHATPSRGSKRAGGGGAPAPRESAAALAIMAPGRDEYHLLFEVLDTGKGVPNEAKQSLFKPFSQLQNDRGGTGLGLFSVLEKSRILGGEAGLRDNTPRGAVFWFSVPYRQLAAKGADAAEDQAANPKEPITPVAKLRDTAPSAKASHRLLKRPSFVSIEEKVEARVLVVEDSRLLQKMMTAMLTRLGFSASTADNGKVALEVIKTGLYAAVFSDVNMPVMDGPTFVRAMREWEAESGRRRQLVFGLSANASEEDIADGLEAGFDQWLSKPLGIQDLANALHVACRDMGAVYPKELKEAEPSAPEDAGASLQGGL